MAHDGVIADTDVVIDFLRGHGTGVGVVRDLLRGGRLLLSSITLFELTSGARTDADTAAVDAFSAGRVVPFGVGAAVSAGTVGRELRTAGTPIGAADTMIAGLCLHHGFALATGNRQHFSRVPGLLLHDA